MIAYPEQIDHDGFLASIYFRAPSFNISNDSTTINLEYGNWADNMKSTLEVDPEITSAHIDIDSRVMTIKGYGFSQSPKENIITYMYTDGTVIDPKVKILGVYSTEEGQEIRIQVLDNYHYGFVTVQVGDEVSERAEFGPVYINKVARRIEFVKSLGEVKGVLYISGYHFGPSGGVRVGEVWADVHYRSNFFIIAVVDQANVYDNPIIVAKE